MNAMDYRRPSPATIRQKLPAILLILVIAMLWFTGGSSRGDVSGQIFARLITWVSIAAMAFSAVRFHVRDSRPVILILLACILVPAMFLIPLPYAVWDRLPGRERLSELPATVDVVGAWFPATLSPGATLNALFSLSVPVAVLLLLSGMGRDERGLLPTILLFLVVGSMLAGLAQLSGISFNSPFVNHQPESVSGTFANRNHYALLLAIGCVATPVWACMRESQMRWRVPLAVGVVFLLALTILAVGSRAGMLLGVVAILLIPFVLRERLSGVVIRKHVVGPKTILALIVAFLVLLVGMSLVFGRATSLERFGAFDFGGDMRTFGLPTVLEIAKSHFPVGIGPGAFDAAFRIYEPTEILNPRYFNHAHNDLIEIILESGIFGAGLMVVAMGWWMVASLRVWRHTKMNKRDHFTGRLGSATILLVVLASAVDYPARTPLMMAVIVIAACWLAWGARPAFATATLPEDARSL